MHETIWKQHLVHPEDVKLDRNVFLGMLLSLSTHPYYT